MAYTVQLRDESGEVLDELVLSALPVVRVPEVDDSASPVLRFIDPYGDTILNAAQAAALAEELTAVNQSSERDAKLLTALASRCSAAVHQYLWFIGD